MTSWVINRKGMKTSQSQPDKRGKGANRILEERANRKQRKEREQREQRKQGKQEDHNLQGNTKENNGSGNPRRRNHK